MNTGAPFLIVINGYKGFSFISSVSQRAAQPNWGSLRCLSARLPAFSWHPAGPVSRHGAPGGCPGKVSILPPVYVC